MAAQLEARGLSKRQVIKDILAGIPTYGIVAACQKAGITHKTWRVYCREDPKLDAKAKQLLNDSLYCDMDVAQDIGRSLGEQALTGDRQAQLDYLRGYIAPVALRMAQSRLPEYKRQTETAVEVDIGPRLAALLEARTSTSQEEQGEVIDIPTSTGYGDYSDE